MAKTNVEKYFSVVGVVELQIVTGDAGATAAATVTPISRNTGKSPLLSATITEDTIAYGFDDDGAGVQ